MSRFPLSTIARPHLFAPLPAGRGRRRPAPQFHRRRPARRPRVPHHARRSPCRTWRPPAVAHFPALRVGAQHAARAASRCARAAHSLTLARAGWLRVYQGCRAESQCSHSPLPRRSTGARPCACGCGASSQRAESQCSHSPPPRRSTGARPCACGCGASGHYALPQCSHSPPPRMGTCARPS